MVCLGTPTHLHEVWGHEETDRQTWLLVLGLEQGLAWFHIVSCSPHVLFTLTGVRDSAPENKARFTERIRSLQSSNTPNRNRMSAPCFSIDTASASKSA